MVARRSRSPLVTRELPSTWSPTQALWVRYRRVREWARQCYRRIDKAVADRFFPYDAEGLTGALRRLGIAPGDTVLVHSAFKCSSGFRGDPQDVIQALLDAVGSTGNLMMVSMPYSGSTYDYLWGNPVFDVRKTPSRMGILSEIFRRRRDVVRSLHPTHPVLACGERASWIVEGHERNVYPCGEGTPFAKLRELDGKTLFFDVPFYTFTFIHYIEDHIKEQLPFSLYVAEPTSTRVRDARGQELDIKTYAFSSTAVRARRPGLLRDALVAEGLLRKARIGRTSLLLVRVEDAVQLAERMVARGQHFYAV